MAAFEYNLDQELLDRQEELQAQSYHPGGYRHFMVYDGKPRLFSRLEGILNIAGATHLDGF